MNEEDDLVNSTMIMPIRVNEPAIVFLGCTMAELYLLSVIFFIFWLFVCLVVGFFIGKIVIMSTFAVLFTMISVVLTAFWIRRFKQDKPSGYQNQKWDLFCEDCSIGVSHLYRADGQLQLGRSKQHINKRRL